MKVTNTDIRTSLLPTLKSLPFWKVLFLTQFFKQIYQGLALSIFTFLLLFIRTYTLTYLHQNCCHLKTIFFYMPNFKHIHQALASSLFAFLLLFISTGWMTNTLTYLHQNLCHFKLFPFIKRLNFQCLCFSSIIY